MKLLPILLLAVSAFGQCGPSCLPPAYTIKLAWDASAGAAGYNVYRATAINGQYVRQNASLVTVTAWSDANVAQGGVYAYYVTAVGDSGAESGESNTIDEFLPATTYQAPKHRRHR